MANEFFTDEHTAVLQKLIKEIVNDPKTYLGSKYLPSVSLPSRKIRTEVIEASGGLTKQHLVGTDPQYIQSFGSRVQEFEAPAYKEAIRYDEEKLLYLRELGQNDPSKAGVQQAIDIDVDRLNRRLEARIEYERWNAIFTGGFSYLNKTFSYGFNTLNRVVPSVLWSLDGVTANASANPILDLLYWLQGGYATFRKYNVTGMIMNPNTARWILTNPNTRTYLTSYGANPQLTEFEVNKVLKLVAPGLPDVTIYKGWYQEESIVNDKIVVGDAIFMIPDGYIFFECSLPGNDKIGEFQQGIHLASGSIASPGVGKFLVIEDNTVPGSKGGPTNPFMNIVSGVYGGVKMDRPFDVLTAKVIA